MIKHEMGMLIAEVSSVLRLKQCESKRSYEVERLDCVYISDDGFWAMIRSEIFIDMYWDHIRDDFEVNVHFKTEGEFDKNEPDMNAVLPDGESVEEIIPAVYWDLMGFASKQAKMNRLIHLGEEKSGAIQS